MDITVTFTFEAGSKMSLREMAGVRLMDWGHKLSGLRGHFTVDAEGE